MTAEVAGRHQVETQALRIRTLLHLPRIAGYSGMSEGAVYGELHRVARQLAADTAATSGMTPTGTFALRELEFAEVPESQAAPIIARRHYLRSSRPDSRYYALLDPVQRLPVSVCSVSPLQWRRVAAQINRQSGIPADRMWDISRVYSDGSAPPNSISFLLSRVRSAVRRSGDGVDLLTTSVDTNLGFTGASYRAANWQHWITVQPRPYLYLNGSYISPRQLKLKFGSAAIADLQEAFPKARFEQSRVRLKESLIFCWRIRKETELIAADARRPIHR